MKLNLGCGPQVLDSWTNVDYALGAKLAKVPLFQKLNARVRLLNLDWDDRIVVHDLRKTFPWANESVTAIYTSHTLEHLSRADGLHFLQECHRVLARGGLMRVVVPNLRAYVRDYEGGKIRADEFIESLGVLYGTGKVGVKRLLAPFFEFPHKCMYDPDTMTTILAQLGFECAERQPFHSQIQDIREIELEERTRDAVIVEGRKR